MILNINRTSSLDDSSWPGAQFRVPTVHVEIYSKDLKQLIDFYVNRRYRHAVSQWGSAERVVMWSIIDTASDV